jgi:hypothetical protein
MMMRKTARAAALMGATAILGLGMGIGPAFAVTAAPTVTKTWTIKPGGTVKAKSGQTVLIDTTTKNPVKCASSTATAKLKHGSKLKGAKIGKITSIAFTHCKGTGGVSLKVKSTMPWYLNAVSYNKKTGVTSGTITGIHSVLSNTTLGCSITVDGTAAGAKDGMVKFTYRNSTHKLTILAKGDNLHAYKVTSGCLGLVNSGDGASFHGVYVVRPHQKIKGS